MGRNYAALPHDYLQELSALTDEEFGRLCRQLLLYSATGELPEPTGAERYVLGMVLSREQRYQQSYEQTVSRRSEAGRKAAQARWHGEDMRSHASDAYTETETETDTKTEDETDFSRVTHARQRFVPPSAEEVAAYCTGRGYGMDAEEFCCSYAARGWMMGSTPMRDWRAAADMWEHNRKKMPPRKGGRFVAGEAAAQPGLSAEENQRALDNMAAIMREMTGKAV